MMPAHEGFLDIGASRLVYRMVGLRSDRAATIVLLHEGLGCAGMWGDFPSGLAEAAGLGAFAYSRAGYGLPACPHGRVPKVIALVWAATTSLFRLRRAIFPVDICVARCRGLADAHALGKIDPIRTRF